MLKFCVILRKCLHISKKNYKFAAVFDKHMNARTKIILLLVFAWLMVPGLMMGKQRERKKIWSDRPSPKHGLYAVKNYFVSHGVNINANALYYFGDVDNEGVAFNGGFNLDNLSLGGSLLFAYNLPVGNYCNLRFALMGGTLRGNNELKFKTLNPPRDDFRKFSSILIQPAVGVQYYPFIRAGFYLYGGVAFTASIIRSYEFYYNKKISGSQKERRLLQGKTFGFLPMVQLGLGYSWRLTESWVMSAEIMLQEGLIDTHYLNLDAWPLAASQNSDQVELGGSFGTYTDRYGKQQLHWNDGWFQVGLTVTYQWNTCEHCRILNNYTGLR